MMSEGVQAAKPTIAQVLSESLAKQERRLSGKSFSRYRQVVRPRLTTGEKKGRVPQS